MKQTLRNYGGKLTSRKKPGSQGQNLIINLKKRNRECFKTFSGVWKGKRNLGTKPIPSWGSGEAKGRRGEKLSSTSVNQNPHGGGGGREEMSQDIRKKERRLRSICSDRETIEVDRLKVPLAFQTKPPGLK